MPRTMFRMLVIAFALSPVIGLAQGLGANTATFITGDEVTTVNALPGTDHTLKVVDLGTEHFSIGVVHRGPTAGAGRGAAAGRGAGAAGRGAAPASEPCGEPMATPPATGGAPGMIAHDSQTEGYYIISGGGTVITGGHIVNGRRSAPNSDVTTTLNGPSCSGTAYGADMVRKTVKTGDIIIIPAGLPHGWTDITDHVDYLSFRPSDHILTAGYVNPAIKK